MSASDHSGSPAYSKNTIEFLAVAKSYCDFLEDIESVDRNRFIETMLRLLPLLYLKGSLLPETELISDGEVERFATETHYGLLAEKMSELLGEDDSYLNAFDPDVILADGPVAASISENIADIWQALYDFIEVFRLGYDETMNDALYLCRDDFAAGWGQQTLDALRALHSVKYNGEEAQSY